MPFSSDIFKWTDLINIQGNANARPITHHGIIPSDAPQVVEDNALVPSKGPFYARNQGTHGIIEFHISSRHKNGTARLLRRPRLVFILFLNFYSKLPGNMLVPLGRNRTVGICAIATRTCSRTACHGPRALGQSHFHKCSSHKPANEEY
jgi:hypothetical protein